MRIFSKSELYTELSDGFFVNEPDVTADFVEEAEVHGIYPGAVVFSPLQDKVFIVGPIENWRLAVMGVDRSKGWRRCGVFDSTYQNGLWLYHVTYKRLFRYAWSYPVKLI